MYMYLYLRLNGKSKTRTTMAKKTKKLGTLHLHFKTWLLCTPLV